MKRGFSIWFSMMVVVLVSAIAAMAQGQEQTQSLGSYARAVKKDKNPPATKTAVKVYDNDNIPKASALSVVGPEAGNSEAAAKEDAAKAEEKDAAKDSEPKIAPGQPSDERKEAINEWQSKIDEQKGKVDLLSRELDVLEKERQLKAAQFYADTSRRTQQPNGFVEENSKYEDKINEKKKALDEAKTKLSDLEDQAHRSGAPNSVAE
jgi:hypothetical protein